MNKAKKLAKNDGVGLESKIGSGGGAFELTKNKVLVLLGVIAVLVLCGGVCYMQLRPRVVLEVTGTDADGSTTKSRVYMKETVYDIFQTEKQCNMYSQIYQQMYGKTYWEMEDVDGSGRDGATAAKKQVMDSVKQREILCMEAKKLNYSLSDEEKATVKENVKQAIDSLSDEQKKIDGMDEKSLTTAFEKNALAEKYRQVIISESGIDEEALKATVVKEDYRQYTMQYYMVSNKEGTGDEQTDVTPEKKQENLTNMQALKEKAATAEDFTKLVEDGDTTGISTYKEEDLLQKDMESSSFLTKKLRKKLIKMQNGEISDVIEGEDGYYLVKMVNNDDPAAYDEQCTKVVEDEESEKFKERYSQIAAGYTAEIQSYWKGRVHLGNYTTVAEAND